MKQFYKKFLSKKSMYEELAQLPSNIDFATMLSELPSKNPLRYYMVMKDGSRFVSPNTKHFFSMINSHSDMNFFAARCFNRGANIINVFSKDDYFNTEPEVDLGIVEPEFVEILAEESVEVVEKDATIDMKLAMSMTDKKELDMYAEQFGIKLRRNKSLENMKKDLKKAVDKVDCQLDAAK